MHKEDSSTAMDKGTASVLELENRCLFEPQKHRKRVSFKDEAWVINIPPCEESHVDLRRSVILTRNAVANGTLTSSRRPSLETFSSRASLYANKDQTSPQAHSCRIVSSGHATHRGPYKSILKTSIPSRQKEDHLHRSQMSAGHLRDVSARNSVDSYFKQSPRHLLPSKDSVNRLEKDAFTRPLPAKRSPLIPRALGSENDFSYSKTGRFIGKEYSASGRPAAVELNYNQYHHNKRGDNTKNTATQPIGANFNIVGVTYRSVNEMPYFYDRGLANRINEYSSATKSTLNGQACLEHSSVPKPLNQFSPPKKEERHFSAIPAIEAFNRRNRGTRRHYSSAWSSEQVNTSPKRQLPIAWQPAKQYNFSTK